MVFDAAPVQVELLLASLPADCFLFERDPRQGHRSVISVVEVETAWKVDLVLKRARPFSTEELARRQRTRILGIDVAVATAEDTIIAKLEWAKLALSDRQLDDVAGILRVAGTALDLGYIERWVTELELADEWLRARDKV